MMRAVSFSADPAAWRIIVPVRGGPAGKSRLAQIEGRPLTETERAEVALAMARDTLRAAVSAARGRVLVLTGDPVVASVAHESGAEVTTDGGQGLNTELAGAARTVPREMGVCVVLADLPAVRPEDLGAALDLADGVEGPGIVVPDWEGTGTALVAVTPAGRSSVVFGFGPGSATRHRRAGLLPAGLDLDRIRTDVDTSAAWDRAARLGLGASTAALRRRLLGPPSVT